MTSQPDPKDGPPTDAQILAGYRELWGNEPISDSPDEVMCPRDADRWWEMKRVLVAALRVVPPEARQLDAADLERAADVLEWDTENGNDEERNAELLGIVARFRTFAAALRASGAGTRQEEPFGYCRRCLQRAEEEAYGTPTTRCEGCEAGWPTHDTPLGPCHIVPTEGDRRCPQEHLPCRIHSPKSYAESRPNE